MMSDPTTGRATPIEGVLYPSRDKSGRSSVSGSLSASSNSDRRPSLRDAPPVHDTHFSEYSSGESDRENTSFSIANTEFGDSAHSVPARRIAAQLAVMAANPFTPYISAGDITDIAEVASKAFRRESGANVKEYILSHTEFTNPIHRGLLIALFATIECNPAAPFTESSNKKDDTEDIASSVMLTQRCQWWMWLLFATKFMPGGARARPVLWLERSESAMLINVAAALACKSYNGHIPEYMVRAATRKVAAVLEPFYGLEMMEFLLNRVSGYAVEGFRDDVGEHVGMFIFMLMDAATDRLMPYRPLAYDAARSNAVRLLTFRRSINMMTYAMHCIPRGAANSVTLPAARPRRHTIPQPNPPRSAACEVS